MNSTKQRISKVANLPGKIRTWVNAALARETGHEEILESLARKGFPDITRQNLDLWQASGHKEWLLNQRRLQQLRLRADAALEVARTFQQKDTAAFGACNQILLLSQINDILQDYDPQSLKRLLEDKPEQFLRLAGTLNAQASEQTRRSKLELDHQKYRDKVAEQKRKIQQAVQQTHAKGLTPEVLAQIEEAARLL